MRLLGTAMLCGAVVASPGCVSHAQQFEQDTAARCRQLQADAIDVRGAAGQVADRWESTLIEAGRKLRAAAKDPVSIDAGVVLTRAELHAAERATGFGIAAASPAQIAAERALLLQAESAAQADKTIAEETAMIVADVRDEMARRKQTAAACWDNLAAIRDTHAFMRSQDAAMGDAIDAEWRARTSDDAPPAHRVDPSLFTPPAPPPPSPTGGLPSYAPSAPRTWGETPYAPMIPPVMRDEPVENVNPMIPPAAR